MRFAFADADPTLEGGGVGERYSGAVTVLDPMVVRAIADRLEDLKGGGGNKQTGIGDIVQRMGGIKWCDEYYTEDFSSEHVGLFPVYRFATTGRNLESV